MGSCSLSPSHPPNEEDALLFIQDSHQTWFQVFDDQGQLRTRAEVTKALSQVLFSPSPLCNDQCIMAWLGITPDSAPAQPTPLPTLQLT
jgi:hypothetical protein